MLSHQANAKIDIFSWVKVGVDGFCRKGNKEREGEREEKKEEKEKVTDFFLF